ncbi:hypothetical protein OEV98_05530 [Caldibacillus lycopersici]|uniref:Uncharacterized protein n=2 Tax=Perspicuibacillus lycopersici TaxID=1325689 RepID=A0AAE3IR21_9BACI|nr:hypothetical protein [Perspicuibacillus lycopersici]
MWEFTSRILSKNAVRTFHLCIINPLLILLYLSKLPKTNGKRILYVCQWIGLSAFTEWLGNKYLHMITFRNGWNLGWSICIYINMYTLTLLMRKRFLLAWVLSFFTTWCYVKIFHIPVKKNMQEYKRELSVVSGRMRINLHLVTIVSTIIAIIIGVNVLEKKRKRLFSY